MLRLDEKLARIRAGAYTRKDFIIADAKDPDMGPSLWATGPINDDGKPQRWRSRDEFLNSIEAILAQDVVDIMLASASNLEQLVKRGAFRTSRVKPAIRANDTTDIWQVRGGNYAKSPSRPFRTASLAHVRAGDLLGRGSAGGPSYITDLGLYSITFNNDIDADMASLEAFAKFRHDAHEQGFKYFLEVFNPNAAKDLAPDVMPHFVNDCIVRCLAGLTVVERPEFLKIAYNGPKALEELASWDSTLVVGVLGGGAGTTRDCFELLHQAEKYGARVALFGRKINLAESPLDIVHFMRAVADGELAPAEAVKAYHDALSAKKINPTRTLKADSEITEAALKH